MTYITTKVRSLKSYPTYQFYAKAESKATDVGGVFRICVLEAMRWIRNRLENIKDIPEELKTPEPADFKNFSENRLSSFSFDNGFQIDVIYIESLGVWSFRMAEPDLGANLGTDRERLPVSGRTFTTEIAFLKQTDCVELGIRTICSEPSDNDTDCEVFRPRVVKALAENENLRLLHSGWMISGEPLTIKSKSELERFLDIFEDEDRSLPIFLVADSGTEAAGSLPETLPDVSVPFSLGSYKLSGGNADDKQRLSISPELLSYKAGTPDFPKPKKQKSKTPEKKGKPLSVGKKLPCIDYGALSKKLIGFAIVVFAEESFFGQIEKKTKISLNNGDIVIIPRKQPSERLTYKSYENRMPQLIGELYEAAAVMPKRSAFQYGSVLFHYDAKQKDFHSKRKQTQSMEERCALYKQENTELKQQIKELSQQQTDMCQTAESIRLLKKQADTLQRALDETESEFRQFREAVSSKEDSYRRSAEAVQFYREQYETAARFPTDKNDVCKWIESSFSDELTVAPRAESEMRKYSGALDLVSLCDGIVYLDAYARYRRREISEDELGLYAMRCNWDVQGCGKEALKMHRSDYTVTVGNDQYTLDLHIKHGRQSEELIRIYFCWDADSEKVIIGSMPEHLATVRNGT